MRAFYTGFVAEAIELHCRTELMDSSGSVHRGLVAGEDLARFEAHHEPPVTADFHGWTVAKCGPWSQGPVFLQQLRLLEPYDLGGAGFLSAEHIHLVTECAKLAFADRAAWYGDPDFGRGRPRRPPCARARRALRSAHPAETSRTSGRSNSFLPARFSATTSRRRSTRRCSTPRTFRARSRPTRPTLDGCTPSRWRLVCWRRCGAAAMMSWKRKHGLSAEPAPWGSTRRRESLRQPPIRAGARPTRSAADSGRPPHRRAGRPANGLRRLFANAEESLNRMFRS